MNLNQVTLPAVDMARSVHFYSELGFTLIVDTPHYARFECPHGDATFSLLLSDSNDNNSTTIYFEHKDLDVWVQNIKQKGIEFLQDPQDQRYLWREAILLDPTNNKLKLYWAGENRKNPPWRVTS